MAKIKNLLSIENSKLQNDPLVQTENTDFLELRIQPVPRFEEFAGSHQGLVLLARNVYECMCDANAMLRKQLPEPMWLYYVVQHYWVRIAYINMHRGYETEDARLLAQSFMNKQFPLPSAISAYLRGIEDVRDPNGTLFHLRPPPYPRRDESYGRVSFGNHYLYESYPAPRIIVETLMAFVDQQEGRAPYYWDLSPPYAYAPEQNDEDEEDEDAVVERQVQQEIRQQQQQPLPPQPNAEQPDLADPAMDGNNRDAAGAGRNLRPNPRRRRQQEQPALQQEDDVQNEPVLREEGDEDSDESESEDELVNRPTVNLLGWLPRARVKQKTIELLRSLGVTATDFTHSVNTFLYNGKIMEHVSRMLRNTNIELDLMDRTRIIT